MMNPKNPPDVTIEIGKRMSFLVWRADQMPIIAPIAPPTAAPIRNPFYA